MLIYVKLLLREKSQKIVICLSQGESKVVLIVGTGNIWHNACWKPTNTVDIVLFKMSGWVEVMLQLWDVVWLVSLQVVTHLDKVKSC